MKLNYTLCIYIAKCRKLPAVVVNNFALRWGGGRGGGTHLPHTHLQVWNAWVAGPLQLVSEQLEVVPWPG